MEGDEQRSVRMWEDLNENCLVTVCSLPGVGGVLWSRETAAVPSGAHLSISLLLSEDQKPALGTLNVAGPIEWQATRTSLILKPQLG